MGGGPRTPPGHNGVHGRRSMDTLVCPMASTQAICCQGHSMSCPLFSWVSADLHGGRMVSAWNSREPRGQPRNSGKTQ